MNVLQAPFKFFQYARRFGAATAVFKTLSKLGLIADLRGLNIFCIDLCADGQKGISEGLPNLPLRVQVTCADELARLRLVEDMPPPDVFQKKFSQGSVLFTVRNGDTVLAVGWYDDQFADLGYIGKPRVPLLKGHVYMHGAWVAPAFRRTGVGSFLKKAVTKALRQKGYTAAFTATYLDSHVMRWHAQNGFRLWGRLTRFQRGGRSFFRVRRTALGRRFFPAFLEE